MFATAIIEKLAKRNVGKTFVGIEGGSFSDGATVVVMFANAVVKVVFVIIGGDFLDFGGNDTVWGGKIDQNNRQNDGHHRKNDNSKDSAFGTVIDFATGLFGACKMRQGGSGAFLVQFATLHKIILP